jgi:hypothetical protein
MPSSARDAMLWSMQRLFESCLSAAVLTCSAACHTPIVDVQNHRVPEEQELFAAIHVLYDAFCFDPGREPQWEPMRALFAPGASFVAPIALGRPVRAVDAESFVREFQAWIRGSDVGRTGFHESITKVDLAVCGSIAHAWVTFDGFVPEAGIAAAGGSEAARSMSTVGVDSVQFVRSEGRWLLASFTTHYASAAQPLPSRFEADEGRKR